MPEKGGTHAWGDKISKALTGKKLSPEHVEKLKNRDCYKCGEEHQNWIPREIRYCACGCGTEFECLSNSKQKYIRGHNNPLLKWYKYNGINFRSSWEAKYAEYLDEQDIKWEYENYSFPVIYKYKGDKKEGTYRPDFYLPNENSFVEIKGYWYGDGKEKYKAFLNQYNYKTILLEERDLKEIEVI